MSFQPTLAASVTLADLAKLRYPLLGFYKYDGVRALKHKGKLVSRKLRPLDNAALQVMFADLEDGVDGELIWGKPTHENCYHLTESVVTTRDAGSEGVTFYVFDHAGIKGAYTDRRRELELRALFVGGQLRYAPYVWLKTPADVERFEAKAVALGYEGIMLRDPAGWYKEGRSTVREQVLLKLKRFEDSEALVLGVYERQRNTNKLTRDARGYAKRSTHKAGKVGTGLLGGFRCRDVKSGVEFDCGTGVLKRHELKLTGWVNTIIKYRFQPVGVKDKPRFPRYVGRRKKGDM